VTERETPASAALAILLATTLLVLLATGSAVGVVPQVWTVVAPMIGLATVLLMVAVMDTHNRLTARAEP
jgi:hypothetical protein